MTYRNVRRTAELNVTLRDAASKYVKLANIQYRGGNINYIDVLDAQRRYLDAQIGLSNAVRDEHLALVQLLQGAGRRLDDARRRAEVSAGVRRRIFRRGSAGPWRIFSYFSVVNSN